MIASIVAMSKNWAIGADNKLLWRFKEDMEFFRKTTTNHVLIMGRKTFDSLPGILPNREHWVITRDESYGKYNCHEKVRFFTSVEEAMEAARSLPVPDSGIQAFVIGGSEIYKATLPYVDRIYMTYIDAEYEGDTFFPKLGKEFKIKFASDFKKAKDNPWKYRKIIYEK